MRDRKRSGSSGIGLSRRQVLQGLAAAAATSAMAGSRLASGAAPAARSGNITLQYQTANLTEAQYEPVWKALIAKFEAQNPNIKVEPILVARKDHWTKFVTASKANQAPDVVSVDIATAAYNGYLRPLDDLWQAEPASYRHAWTADAIKTASWQGKFYGLPSWGGIYGEIYNKDMVRQAGLDLSKPPATWNEYLDWSKKLTREGQQWALAILAGKTDSTTRMLLMWIWSNGGEAFNADMTQATFAANPKSLEALEFYLNLDLVHKVVAPGAASINYLEQTNLFAQQKIASMRNAYWGVAKVVGDNPAIKDKIAVAFPPMNAGKRVTRPPWRRTASPKTASTWRPPGSSSSSSTTGSGGSGGPWSPTGCRSAPTSPPIPRSRKTRCWSSSWSTGRWRGPIPCPTRSGRTSRPTTSWPPPRRPC
jgi:ABC-type glycerol-3-phosphate transport system substrate-binding protein